MITEKRWQVQRFERLIFRIDGLLRNEEKMKELLSIEEIEEIEESDGCEDAEDADDTIANEELIDGLLVSGDDDAAAAAAIDVIKSNLDEEAEAEENNDDEEEEGEDKAEEKGEAAGSSPRSPRYVKLLDSDIALILSWFIRINGSEGYNY